MQKKGLAWPGQGELHKILGFPFNIFTTAESSDFKFGTQLGSAKAHYKIAPKIKSGGGLGLGDLFQILGLPYNISATAGASDFKFGTHLEFAKANHKNHTQRKSGRGLGL